MASIQSDGNESVLVRPTSYDPLDPRNDAVRAEAETLLVKLRSCLQYAEEACKLEEDFRDVEKRRLDAFLEREAAVTIQAVIQRRIGLVIILVVCLVSIFIGSLVMLAHALV